MNMVGYLRALFLFLLIFSNIFAGVHITEACEIACTLVNSDGSILDKEAACKRVLSKLRALTVKAGVERVNEADIYGFVARERLYCCPCDNVPSELRRAFNAKLAVDVQENYRDKAAPLVIFSLGSGGLKQERDIAEGLLEADYTNIVFIFADLLYARNTTAVKDFCQSFGSDVTVALSENGVLPEQAGKSIRVLYFGHAEEYIEAVKRDDRLWSNVFLNIDPNTTKMPFFSKSQLVEKVADLGCDPEFASASLQHSVVLLLKFRATDGSFTNCRLIKRDSSMVIHFDKEDKIAFEDRQCILSAASMCGCAERFQSMLKKVGKMFVESSLKSWSHFIDTDWLFYNVMEHTRNLNAPVLTYKLCQKTVFDFREAFNPNDPTQNAIWWMHETSLGDFIVMDRSGSLRRLR